MAIAIDPGALLGPQHTAVASRTKAIAVAGFASLGAGAVHAAAVGVHNEHPQAVRVFVVAALFQLAWGALAQRRSSAVLALAGIAGNGALVTGWALAKTNGIGFVDGLGTSEPVQFADGLAAALAIVAVLGALTAFLRPSHSSVRSSIASLAALAIAGVTLPGMVAAGGHRHAHDETTAATAAGTDESVAHVHTADQSAVATVSGLTAEPAVHQHAADDATTGSLATADDTADHTATTAAHDHTATPSAVPTVAYDPTKPLDFGGVDGVTPEQQAAAENLVAITLLRLPKFADPAVAEALGWRSIGDGFTGHEHFINWDLINDADHLNPDMPESLVYEVPRGGGERKLVSAMFMLPDTVALTDVPDIGGALMQWHIHDNLCFTIGDQPRVAGVTSSGGGCGAGLQTFPPAPMIHVWITPHPCGPFAALEGAGAGQIAPGEERLCDHVHGSGF